MKCESSKLWKLRILGRHDELADALRRATFAESKRVLIGISLVRARSGARRAQQIFHQADVSGAVSVRDGFDYFYQPALNLYAMGEYSNALEWILKIRNTTVSATEAVLSATATVAVFQRLNFDYNEALASARNAMKEPIDPSVRAVLEDLLETVERRAAFSRGDLETASFSGGGPQSGYFAEFVGALPYFKALVGRGRLKRWRCDRTYFITNTE